MSQSPSWSRISLQGPDAPDFLHRLTTVNVKQMKPGDGRPGFFLTPQAKVRAYFWLWRLTPEEFIFELAPGLEDHWKQNLLSFIDQFHFAEKFEIAELPEMQCRWIFPDQEEGTPLRAESRSDGLVFFHHGSADFGRPWISVWGSAEKVAAIVESLDAVQTQNLRVLATRPWFDSEITENTNPLEIGLPEAISSNKGCYPGQEVIEKIISLGAPAKRLVKIEGTGALPTVGTVLSASDQSEAGTVTTVSPTMHGFVALAILKKIYAKEGQALTFLQNQVTVSQIAPYV
jgi:folate-binding protein YgfZ